MTHSRFRKNAEKNSLVSAKMQRSHSRVVSFCLCSFVLFLYLLTAQPVTASSGLAEYEQPWEICALCHSLDGNSRMGKFPKLAGQPRAYLEKQLGDFLSGTRVNDGGQMSSIVTEVAKSDFEAIAIWYSSQEHPLPIEVQDQTRAAGRSVFRDSGCSECHVSSSDANERSLIPILASQHSQYLRKQLIDFQEGNRSHIPALLATDLVLKLTEVEIDVVVNYLESTARE